MDSIVQLASFYRRDMFQKTAIHWLLERFEKVVIARFCRPASGGEAVREWLRALPCYDRNLTGRDILRVESCWPGIQPCAPKSPRVLACLRSRSRLAGRRTAGVTFTWSEKHMVLLRGFVRKTQVIPLPEIALATRRQEEHERHA